MGRGAQGCVGPHCHTCVPVGVGDGPWHLATPPSSDLPGPLGSRGPTGSTPDWWLPGALGRSSSRGCGTGQGRFWESPTGWAQGGCGGWGGGQELAFLPAGGAKAGCCLVRQRKWAASEQRVAGGARWPAGVSVQLMGLDSLGWAVLQALAAEAWVCGLSGAWASGSPRRDTRRGCLPVPLAWVWALTDAPRPTGRHRLLRAQPLPEWCPLLQPGGRLLLRMPRRRGWQELLCAQGAVPGRGLQRWAGPAPVGAGPVGRGRGRQPSGVLTPPRVPQ